MTGELDGLISEYNEKMKKIASLYAGDLCDDIVQDAWVKILDKKHLLANVRNIDNWLFLVVRNICFDYLRVEKKKRKSFTLTPLENIDFKNERSFYPDVIELIIRRESSHILNEIIGGLPEFYSLPFIMRHVKDMNLNDISAALDLPVSTVKWRIHACKLQMKKEIIKRGLL